MFLTAPLIGTWEAKTQIYEFIRINPEEKQNSWLIFKISDVLVRLPIYWKKFKNKSLVVKPFNHSSFPPLLSHWTTYKFVKDAPCRHSRKVRGGGWFNSQITISMYLPWFNPNFFKEGSTSIEGEWESFLYKRKGFFLEHWNGKTLKLCDPTTRRGGECWV